MDIYLCVWTEGKMDIGEQQEGEEEEEKELRLQELDTQALVPVFLPPATSYQPPIDCFAYNEWEAISANAEDRPFNLGPGIGMGFATSSPSATSGGGGQSNSPVRDIF